MKAIIVVNPHAHSDASRESGSRLRDAISARLTDSLHLDQAEWCETDHPNHGRELAEQAVRDGYDYIFAAGGDGTINEVLNGLMSGASVAKTRPALGVLPFGTSNDFFASLQTTENAHVPPLQGVVTMPLDIGHVQFDSVERYFCLTVGIGMFSLANEQYLELSHYFSRRFAHIPAAITTAFTYRFRSGVHITRDGVQSRAKQLLTVMVNNGPRISGGIRVTPDAKLDDGYLDVAMVKAVSLLALLKLIFQVGIGTHLHSKSIEIGQIKTFTLTSRHALPLHVDGELIPEIGSKARQMTVKELPAALQVVLPSLCALEVPVKDVV